MRMNALFDFYHPLLTDKQRNYLQLYYSDDYSLGEISESFAVSRQAVYDNIRRSELMLEEYEEKLLLYHRYRWRQRLYKELRQEAGSEPLLSIIEELEQSEE
ncbi:putative DNA-binding protein [Geomicrobium halophilum]